MIYSGRFHEKKNQALTTQNTKYYGYYCYHNVSNCSNIFYSVYIHVIFNAVSKANLVNGNHSTL